MSSSTTMGAARFQRMTKEEKLRFCQDLIRQAANFRKKPSGANDDRSTRSRSSKRPASVGSKTSKKTKSGASNRMGRSKSRDKLSTGERAASKSPDRVNESLNDLPSFSVGILVRITLINRFFKI